MKQATLTFAQWLRRPQVWGFFVSMAIMAVVSVAFFAPDNFDGNSLAQHDMQQGAANGQEGLAYEQATGEKALWTNALFGGMPTFQISPSYPSNSLFQWIDAVYGLCLPAPSNLLFMMMMGMLIMCYCLRMRWYYALIAALGWGLSSYFVIIIGAGHIWKFLALTYVPPMVGGAVLAYNGRRIAGAAILGVAAMMQLNANHPQITYYALYILGFMAVAYLVNAIANKQVKQWLLASAICAAAGLVAVGANLPSLYNTYEYAKETKRAGSELAEAPKPEAGKEAERPTGGLPKSEIGGWSNTPGESLSLLVPNVKGGASIRPEQGQNTMLSVDRTEAWQNDYNAQSADQFGLAQQFGQYFGGKGMTNGPFYFGALIVALFILGCIIVRGPLKWAMLLVSVFSVLLAMGNHFEALTDFMIYNVPLYNKFRAAETALVIAALCVPLMALLGLQKLLSEENALRRHRTALCVSFGVCMAVCAALWLWPGIMGGAISTEEAEALEGMRQQLSQYPLAVQENFEATLASIESVRLGLVSADAGRSLLVLVLGAGAVALACVSKSTRTLGIAGVGLIVLVDMYTVDKRYVSHESFAASSVATVDALAADDIDKAILADKGYYRVADLREFGSARRSFYHHMVGGYHAAKLNRFNDLINYRLKAATGYGLYDDELRNDSVIAASPANQQPAMRALAADYRVLDMLNAKYVIDKEGLKINPHAMGAGWIVGKVNYVDNAKAEMQALATIDPTAVAVADRRMEAILGSGNESAVPGDTVQLVKYTPNQVSYRVTAKKGGVAVFSEVYFPWGWQATVDGKPVDIARVNYVLRALRVPAGTHSVVMTFDPASLRVTANVAYACVTLIYMLTLLAVFMWYTRTFGTKKK